MLIGIDASRANKIQRTGTEQYGLNLIREFAAQDDKNQYILYTNVPLQGPLADLTKDYIEGQLESSPVFDNNNYQIIKSPHNNFRGRVVPWPFKYLWTQGGLSMEMIFHTPDILFVPSHTIPFAHPKISIMTIHDACFERSRWVYSHDKIVPEQNIFRKIFSYLIKLFTFNKFSANSLDYLKWSTHFGVNHASTVIAPSDFTKKDLIDFYGAKAEKIKVIPHGYARSHYYTLKDGAIVNSILKKYNISEPYVLFVGRLERKKNIKNLVEAFSILKNEHPQIAHKLVLAGAPGFGFDEVRYRINDCGMENEVIITGWVDEIDMPYLFQGADIFIFPSHCEGFGIPLLQAMASGVAVAASDCSSIPEVVGDAAALFNPNDLNSISSAINKIISDENYKKELVMKGIARVKDFSWEKCAQDTLKEILDI